MKLPGARVFGGKRGRAGISQGQRSVTTTKQVATRMDSTAECEPQAKQIS